MRKWQICLFSTLIIFAISHTCLSADGLNYGRMWLEWSKDARLMWTWGFTEGQSTILEEINSNQAVKQKFKFEISKSDADVISEIMSNLYEDAENSYIPWKYMTYVAKLKLRGIREKEIESQLQLLRQYADYERIKLQQK